MDNPARATILRRMTSDLIIVGGGLNGATLALAAAEIGLSSTVLDANPEGVQRATGFDGRSYALALTSVRLLQALDLWADLAPDAQPMNRIRVSDGRVGDAAVFLGLDFQSAEIEEGPMGHMIEDRHLRAVLMDRMAASPRITHRLGARVVAQEISPHAAFVTLEDGETLSARLLIGADGRQSGTATRAGIRRTGWRYGQTALVCAIAHEKPHDGTAHQLFLPPGPLAILPLTGNRSSIVWSETDAHAAAFNALDDADYLTILRPRFGDFLGDISIAGARFTYPLNLTLANAITGERLVLVGDAAHGVHPIAGQGLNAGLRDIAALADVLKHAKRRGEDIASPVVLARYAEWRRFDTATLALATDIFNRLFSNDNPLVRATRDLGMAAINAVPEARRSFIREAAGLGGDLPEMMRA
ncbi:UbiH/UbiF/VisC/COQ6 family ubiquinone biosynthesis hydroxylase [Cognatishimia sp. F0-27]|uniref:UbiH/UbiF/VisC/COQ6 family ubiquinone biosynthesis hydroxylase n=1 Tax=Cognatishimia sp. F0-27 TaxID=2816855 RepID=UPI001D0C7B0A|nr:UbiH/UbiF/VisC/COQ6 family ubiquinone biosynthesis hydroxylase [Cognatishimia sp. F0-27]MCC1491412.1 UbiH/UbiF/VisC/COQ6 family ubiquinone biosynthesis hydroxylase [Cognatishimia sp. F0-27]